MDNKSPRGATSTPRPHPISSEGTTEGSVRMSHKLSFRQYVLSFLALWNDRNWKQVGAAAGMPQKQVSQHLRRGALTDATFDRLLAAIPTLPGSVEIVTACLEGLAALEQDDDGLTPEEKQEVERAALLASRSMRKGLTE